MIILAVRFTALFPSELRIIYTLMCTYVRTYVHTNHCMYHLLAFYRYEPALSHLISGFHEMVEPADLRCFSEYELQSILSGCTEIDTEEILRDVKLAGGFETALGADYVSWLSDILQEMDHQTLSRFLSFVTGCGNLPVDGLQPPLLLTQAADGTDASLPKAHTCFNQLVFPKYSSKAVFRDRLLYALQNTDDAFHMS
jgi:HECT-domain (ubiquitin-transferase)